MDSPVDPASYSCPPVPASPGVIDFLLDHDVVERGAVLDMTALRVLDPTDAGAWFQQGQLLATHGRPTEALEACRRAMALWPDIVPLYRLFSDLAIQNGSDEQWRTDEQLGLAQRTLLAQQLDDVIPGDAIPGGAILANRIAARLCGEKRFGAALPYLRVAAPVLGHQDSALWNYVTALAVTGQYHELLSIEPMLYARAREVPPPFSPFTHLAAARLALQADRDKVLHDVTTMQGSALWLDGLQLAGKLAEAIHAHRPFSFIRLSEAHARLVAYASLRVHLLLGEAEMSAVVDSVWMDSFGGSIEAHGAAFNAVFGRNLLAAIAEADVVGLPDAAHLATAHEHFGFFAEMQSFVLRREAGYCSGLPVMHEMHAATPFLHGLLAGLPFLGFVGGCLDLARRFAQAAQINEADLRLFPATPDCLEASGALAVPFPGAVFLVAAGVLGPVYCGRVRQLGGIAIDVDTIAMR